MAKRTPPIDFENRSELMHHDKRIPIDTQAKYDAVYHACAVQTKLRGGDQAEFDVDAEEDLKARVRQGLTHEQCVEHAGDDAYERWGKAAGMGKDRQG